MVVSKPRWSLPLELAPDIGAPRGGTRRRVGLELIKQGACRLDMTGFSSVLDDPS